MSIHNQTTDNRTANELDYTSSCAICFEKNINVETECGHLFHIKCLSTWLNRASTCPLCRAPIHRTGTTTITPEIRINAIRYISDYMLGRSQNTLILAYCIHLLLNQI